MACQLVRELYVSDIDIFVYCLTIVITKFYTRRVPEIPDGYPPGVGMGMNSTRGYVRRRVNVYNTGVLVGVCYPTRCHPYT